LKRAQRKKSTEFAFAARSRMDEAGAGCCAVGTEVGLGKHCQPYRKDDDEFSS
jgi:hypothetical protein